MSSEPGSREVGGGAAQDRAASATPVGQSPAGGGHVKVHESNAARARAWREKQRELKQQPAAPAVHVIPDSPEAATRSLAVVARDLRASLAAFEGLSGRMTDALDVLADPEAIDEQLELVRTDADRRVAEAAESTAAARAETTRARTAEADLRQELDQASGEAADALDRVAELGNLLDEAQSKAERTAQEHTQTLASAVTQHRDELAAEQTRHRTELTELAKTHQTEIDTMRADAERKLAAVEADKAAQQGQLRGELDQAAAANRSLESQRDQASTEADRLRSELQDVKAELAALRTTEAAQRAELAQRTAERDAAQAATEAAKTAADQRVSDVKTMLGDQITTLTSQITTLTGELADLRRERAPKRRGESNG